jgi:hypothetical protein
MNKGTRLNHFFISQFSYRNKICSVLRGVGLDMHFVKYLKMGSLAPSFLILACLENKILF